MTKRLTATQIRKLFLNYFIQKDHTYVHSSSVLPAEDKSLLFVNAGMNQFKPLFLGTIPQGHYLTTLKRAVNTQKCIRLGGKHNDLEDVGRDGYHHTFFEMLGNWSFGDYFKKEACTMAWELLTKDFKLPPRKLYVTYFGGDEFNGLAADIECKEIWLSLGIPENHILPFGMKHNFWEMGNTGPCGPCTEIHYDHSECENIKNINSENASAIEIWNLVFIQYERENNGILKRLSNQFVDTGMGLERLTAILQNSLSNYETDLFQPLFKTIYEKCKVRPYTGKYGVDDKDGIDTAYRIVADHARMITVSIADGLLPDSSYAGYLLRKIIRRAFLLSDRTLRAPSSILASLVPHVVNILGDTFPEIIHNIDLIINTVNEEEEILHSYIKRIESTVNRKASKKEILSSEEAFQMYVYSGLPVDIIEDIAKQKDLTIDVEAVKEKIAMKSKTSENPLDEEKPNIPSIQVIEMLKKLNVPQTNDEYKYSYTSCDAYYRFDLLISDILAIVSDNNTLIEEMTTGNHCWVVMRGTNFYSESGGQVSDIGDIAGELFSFKVIDVQKTQGYVFHWGTVTKGTMKVGHEAHLGIDKLYRVRCTRNHTASHMLHGVLRQILPSTFQTTSYIGPLYFRFGFNSKVALNEDEIEKIESIVNSLIKKQLDIRRSVLPLNLAMAEQHLITIPKMVYPEVVNVITIGKEEPNNEFVIVELCCGTHLHNTSHVTNFVITSQRKESQISRSLHVVTGKQAQAVTAFGERVMENVLQMEDDVEQQKNVKTLETALLKNYLVEMRKIRTILQDNLFPLRKKSVINGKLENIEMDITYLIKKFTKKTALKQLDFELQQVIQKNNKKYLVHNIETLGDENQIMEFATNIIKDIPVMFFMESFNGKQILCQCIVPQKYVTSNFNAKKWTDSILQILKGKENSKKQDPDLFCSVTGINIKELSKAIEVSVMYAENSL